MEGFEEVKNQLDILINKCKEFNKIKGLCFKNNINIYLDKNCNIDNIAKELSEKLKISVNVYD